MSHKVTHIERAGYPAVRFTSPAGLAATYVPAAGMLCCSLTYDDLFLEMLPHPVFSLSGGGRSNRAAFKEGYSVSVVYAPANDDVTCFEPMTATTAPFSHPKSLQWVEPGAEYVASFGVIAD